MPALISATMVTLYGISNCDSVRKARSWLEMRGIAYTYHDFRTDGLSRNALQQWADSIGWEALLNRRSRSWKELPENERASINQMSALRLMQANPTLIKRPVLVIDDRIHTGFNEDEFDVLFSTTHSSVTQGL